MGEENFKGSKDRRRFQRFKIKLTVKFFEPNKNKEGTAYTNDFCAEGLALITQEKLSPNTPLELWLHISDQHEPLYVKGEVVWSKPIDDNTYRIGINLEGVDIVCMSRIFRAL